MGPCFFALPKGHGLEGDAAHNRIASLIERLVPADIQGLKPGQVRYTMLLNDKGGVLDDLMIARPAEPAAAGDLYIVVNAGCKHDDWALIEATTAGEANLVRADDRCLLALQGPTAHKVAAEIIDPALAGMSFMTVQRFDAFGRITVTRSGYTGEDGYEILVRAENATELTEKLLAHPEVSPSASARATACVSRPASASTATISIRPRRPSKPISAGPSRSAAAKRRISRARNASCASRS
jgi:aminomethyltransferase